MPGGRPPSDPKERFLSKVKVMPSGCHEWQSTMHRDGYGKFYYYGQQYSAHRAAYTLFVGDFPARKHVLHKCDNRRCVNPEHLFLGAAQDNVDDMDQKGRRGTRTRFTMREADAIRHLLSQGVSQQRIADAWGVHQTAISRIKRNKINLYRKE